MVLSQHSCLELCNSSDLVHSVRMHFEGAGEADDVLEEFRASWAWRILHQSAGGEEREVEGRPPPWSGGGMVAAVVGWWADSCIDSMLASASCNVIWIRGGDAQATHLARMVFHESGRELLKAVGRVAVERLVAQATTLPPSPSSNDRLLYLKEVDSEILGDASRMREVWRRAARRVLKFTDAAGIPAWSVCATGGIVLEVLGLRPANDLDVYISQDYLSKAEAYIKELGRRTVPGLGFDLGIEGADNDLIMNPQRHVILFGAKFAAVREVMRRKEQRGNGVKDVLDLIDLQWAVGHAPAWF